MYGKAKEKLLKRLIRSSVKSIRNLMCFWLNNLNKNNKKRNLLALNFLKFHGIEVGVSLGQLKGLNTVTN